MNKGEHEKLTGRDALKVRTRGELIAALRRDLGYSQEELESRSGVSRTQISRIERDEVVSPGIETIRRLEDALDVPLMDLFINPAEVDLKNFPELRQSGAVLSTFEKKLARKKLNAKELQDILDRVMAEVEKKTDRKETGKAIPPGTAGERGLEEKTYPYNLPDRRTTEKT